MKVYTLLPSLYLVASVFTANAQQPSNVNSNDSGFNIIAKNNGGPSSIVHAMVENNTIEQSKVVGLPIRADADVKTTTVTVTTTRTTTTTANNDGGFGFFGAPKTVTATVLSTPSPVDKTVTVTAAGGATTITAAASTITQKATITVTEKGDTVTTTLPASTVTVSSLPTTASTRARGLFDGFFPPAESSISSSTQGKSISTTASSSTSTGNKLLGDNTGGLFGGRTIALPEKCATQTEFITTTVTKPFELFPKETGGFKFSFPPFSFPTGKPSVPAFSFPSDPKPSGLPGLPPVIPGFPDLPGLKFPNLNDPTEILNAIENIIKVIELVEPRNLILGFIKNIIQEAKKLESNQDKEQSIFSIITQALKSLGQPSAPPLPGLFPFIQSSDDDNTIFNGKQQGLDLEEFLKLLLSDNIEIQKKLQK